MGWYEIGAATVAAVTVATYATLQGATTRDIEVDEVGFFCNAATASAVQICRPANTPVATGTSLLNAVNPDVAVASVATYASTWSSPPTTPTVIFRRISLPATIGAGYVAAWQPGFGLALSKTAGTTQWIVLWNFGGTTGSVLNAYFRAEE